MNAISTHEQDDEFHRNLEGLLQQVYSQMQDSEVLERPYVRVGDCILLAVLESVE